MRYPAFGVTVDLVTFTLREGRLQVLLITRGEAPSRGDLALPGGFVHPDEDLDAAAARELREETGLHHLEAHQEQLRTYGAPHRDPRQRVVSVAYLVMAPDLPDPRAGTDAAHAAWVPIEEA
ncbi:MAG: NUDIX hydrolase, partial [Propionibacteriales bacterium]|nr:NUDIX hydrolase [Propionibacteriales bacterium]